MRVSPEVARPGDTVVITGDGFMECHDSLNGCEAPPTPEAQPAQRVMWRLGDHEDEVAMAVPDSEGRIRVEVQVPAVSGAGSATLSVGGSEPVTLTVR
ncbi:hypothetical protein ACFXP7_08560 [Microbacterium sp. P06]|uniref:hypothetical protein n=1 Tax=unclassified Microbacterium TaxID=2609290 RepID=UPI0037472D72